MVCLAYLPGRSFNGIHVRHLLVLSLTGLLAQSPLTDVDMHGLVLANGDPAVDTDSVLNDPQHEGVRPPRRVGARSGLEASQANLSKS